MAPNYFFIDDIDEFSTADETVRFDLDGAVYEIDLAAANATRLREAFQPWINAARRIGGRRRLRRPAGAVPDRPMTGAERRMAIRVWARLNGYGVAVYGRIPRHVVDAYTAAMRK